MKIEWSETSTKRGIIWVATAGYIALRANQNTPNASTISIYVGASMQVTRI